MHIGTQGSEIVLEAGRIDLVGDDNRRTVRELGGVKRELARDDTVIVHRVASLVGTRDVDHVQDEGGTLDMP